jgi:hypothetical protein
MSEIIVDDENIIKEKKTRNRPSKLERYESERKILITELEERMGLTDDIRGVLLYDLEHNEELKTYLKEKVSEIKKMFKCGSWNYFIQNEEDRSEIGLLKSIFKNEKYNLSNKRRLTERDGIKKIYIEICFNK